MSYDPNYGNDRMFGDKFMPEVKSILGQYLLTGEYEEDDCERNTDLIVLTMETKRIGVRIRRNYYYLNYPDEFTIRYTKASGAKTEFLKIMQGWGDYFFYGFADSDEEHLIKWMVGDFKAFRKYITRHLYMDGAKALESHKHENENGDTFIAFNASKIPDFIVASSDTWTRLNGSLWVPDNTVEAMV